MAGAEPAVALNPFALQRAAFSCVDAGDRLGAEAGFAGALQAFGCWLVDAWTLTWAETRARLIPESAPRASDVAAATLTALPGWLQELHFELFCRAFARYEVEWARMHWRLLESASGVPALANAISLATLREQFCQRQQVTSDLLSLGEVERRDMLRRAERVLLVDRANGSARALAVQGYAGQLQDATEVASPRRRRSGGGLAGPALRRRRSLLSKAPRAARRLRRHVGGPDAVAVLGREVVRDALEDLFRYHLRMSDTTSAASTARRARRMFPEDLQVRQWKRSLRKAGRRV